MRTILQETKDQNKKGRKMKDWGPKKMDNREVKARELYRGI